MNKQQNEIARWCGTRVCNDVPSWMIRRAGAYEAALATLHQMEDAHVCSIMTDLIDQVRYREAMRAVWADLPADVRKRLQTGHFKFA